MPFGSVKVDCGTVTTSEFQSNLASSMQQWRDDQISTVWLEVPMDKGACIAEAQQHGFLFHHAEGNVAYLYCWMVEGRASPIPPFATHKIGVGAFVFDPETREVLVIKEKNATSGWKLPGGLQDLGEELEETAQRETMEETGVDTTFQHVLGFRHQHNTVWGRSDMYIVVQMTPNSRSIQIDESEILECRWMPLDEYVDASMIIRGQPVPGSMNHKIASLVQAGPPTAITRQNLPAIPKVTAGGHLYAPVVMGSSLE
jgi:8-oxo-dGTP pyrophosphatase MutT (NUDIX family)